MRQLALRNIKAGVEKDQISPSFFFGVLGADDDIHCEQKLDTNFCCEILGSSTL